MVFMALIPSTEQGAVPQMPAEGLEAVGRDCDKAQSAEALESHRPGLHGRSGTSCAFWIST